MATELLGAAGARIIPVAGQEPGAAGSDSSVLQPTGSTAKVVVRQASIDELGRPYNPLRDFMALGAVGAAVGAATKEERFRPFFVLSLHEGFHRTMMGPPLCSVGLSGRLVDPETGASTAEEPFILGQEKIRSGITHASWETMTEAEQTLIRDHCLSALRRGISQVLTKLNVID